MTELDKYELKPGGYYAIKLSDDWTFKALEIIEQMFSLIIKIVQLLFRYLREWN